TLIILLILWALRGVGYRLVNRQLGKNPRMLYNWRKVVQYITVIVGIILVGRIWLAGVDTLVTYLGLVSAGIAIALQDPIVSVAGWLFIVWRRPFAIGDRVEIDGIMGDVIDIRVFSFSLLEVGKRIDAEQSTGRIVHIPNGIVFKEAVVNTHQGYPFIWNEIPVLVTFESDWEKAKAILNNIIGELAPDISEGIRRYEKRPDRFVISYGSLDPIIYTSVADSGVLLTMRYLVDPRRKRGSEHDIWEAILRAFHLHEDIDFAYPTQREYLHFQESKKRQATHSQEELTVVSHKARMTADTGFRPIPPPQDE
ncbi:MAG TPA: mechanosensitive ion channel family protein, partial [Chloroflexota bacterium]|nr:mechanosensitive ion channel family protein [Chloroflexota bacterium]